MSNFAQDEFINSLLDNIPIDSKIKKSDIIKETNNNNSETNDKRSSTVYDYTGMSAKDFYHIYYNTQNRQTSELFSSNINQEDIDNSILNLSGSKISVTTSTLGLKHSCGGDHMPSFEQVKHQKLDTADYEAMCRVFDAQYLEEGSRPYKGLSTDYDVSLENEEDVISDDIDHSNLY